MSAHYRGVMLGRVVRWWREHRLDVVFDGVPPVVLLTLGLIDAVTGSLTAPVGRAPEPTALIPGAVACIALVMRRYRPLLTLAIVLLAGVVPPLITPTTLTYWDEFIVWVVALYSCARHLRRSGAFVALGLSALGMLALALEFPELGDPGSLLFNSMLLAAGFAIGLLARSWAASREGMLRAALERAMAEERAGLRERARIARELHDVIAHTITVIVMQAGGARLASRSDPDIAVATLAQIEELGRASLAELRSLLPLLGEAEDDAAVAPQPGLGDIPALCERMRELGLPVTLRVDGDLDGVSPALQLTGYRVVQEGLTNVIKHSGMADTAVRVARSAPGLVTVDVRNRIPADTRRPMGAPLGGSGRGLAGLRERVQLAGGVFSSGASDDDGFTLHVELPVERGRS